jgi:hypothetical protein
MPTAAEVNALGVEFVDASRLAAGRRTTKDRLYTAIGFARSRNKKKVNHMAKSIDMRARCIRRALKKFQISLRRWEYPAPNISFWAGTNTHLQATARRQTLFFPGDLAVERY